MRIVTDACVAGAWALPDEDVEVANAVLRMAPARGLVVPALWWFEIRNLLVTQERRRRLTEAQSTAFLADLRRIPIETDGKPGEATVLGVARRLGLTVYDAAYLELAKRRSLPLATLDRRLAAAAAAEGVELFAA
jgi:predicted nucleic acid-binding protein